MTPAPSDAAVVAAAERLSGAFAARDLTAALACFVTGDDVGYVGSEQGETAAGRSALEALLSTVFARDEAYSWQVTTATVYRSGTFAYLFAEADGLVHHADGSTMPFPYRIGGILEDVAGRWQWRHCQGCEPAGGGF